MASDAATLGRPETPATVGHNAAPVLEVTNLKTHFPVRKGVLRRIVGHVYAVDDVTFSIGGGETLGRPVMSVVETTRIAPGPPPPPPPPWPSVPPSWPLNEAAG